MPFKIEIAVIDTVTDLPVDVQETEDLFDTLDEAKTFVDELLEEEDDEDSDDSSGEE